MIYAQTKISLDMLMELQNTKKMVEKMQEDIHKKCIDCREYVLNAAEICVKPDMIIKRAAQMQETLCKRCPLYPYVLEIEKEGI